MYWNRPMETIDRESLERIQLERLQKTVHRMYTNVAFYRERMQKQGVKPEDIRTLADLKLLPFMDKRDLRDNYPDGTFAAPRSEIVRIHASSGTTGKPIVAGYTQGDIEMWAECVARCLGCAGVTKNDTVQVSYGYGLFTGGLGLHYGVEKIGATVVPTSAGNTKRQLMLMQDLGCDAVACTPSYALMMGETIRDQKIDLSNFKLRVGLFGAEPWTEGMRDEIEKLLGIKALDIYGLTESAGPGVAMECLEGREGLHMWEDYFIPEIIDPATGEPLPDGEMGELTITTIGKEGMPTIRFRTHDLTSIIPEPCKCGRTHRRIRRLHGRTDDMLIIRGVNVFPSQIEGVLIGMEGIGPHYEIVVTKKGYMDQIEVKVELVDAALLNSYGELEALTRRIHDRLKVVLQIDAKVTLVSPNTLKRFEGKAKRVTDLR